MKQTSGPPAETSTSIAQVYRTHAMTLQLACIVGYKINV